MVTRDDAPRGLAAARGLWSGEPVLLLLSSPLSLLLRRREAAERGLANPEEPRGLLQVGLIPVDRVEGSQ